MSKNTKFEIVNDRDEVVGLEEISKILKEGLLSRVAHCWFYTPKGEIIFQHRSPTKDIWPNLLDATVGGKVEPGASYEETIIEEAKEESGTDIKKENLTQLAKIRRHLKDSVRGLTMNNFSMQYAYFYDGKLEDLKFEEGKSVGFEAWPIDKLSSLSPEEKKMFIGDYVSEEKFKQIFKKIKELIHARYK